jgi:hypothetical protein
MSRAGKPDDPGEVLPEKEITGYRLLANRKR